ncbi:hypothetical protein C2E23DRAFT_442826 [Lenzites betulinus]|nr:hypothetical protein C2E23DRAFT_442826 [Lenzites betulinus]
MSRISISALLSLLQATSTGVTPAASPYGDNCTGFTERVEQNRLVPPPGICRHISNAGAMKMKFAATHEYYPISSVFLEHSLT